MVVAAGFVQCGQMPQTAARPKLTRPFETALLLSAGALHRAAADRPAPPRDCLIVHPPGVLGKIVLFPRQSFSRHPAPLFQPGDLPQSGVLASVP